MSSVRSISQGTSPGRVTADFFTDSHRFSASVVVYKRRLIDVLADKGAEIEALAASISGTRDVALEQIEGEAQLVIRPDRTALSRFGIPVNDVMSLVADAIGKSGECP